MQPLMLLLPAALAANVAHRRPRHHCRCRLAATAATATTVVKLTVIYSQKHWQQKQHHQRTNGSTNLKKITFPDDLDLFNLPTVFLPLGVCTTVSVRTTVSTICW
jgi:hypothetical protein